MDTLEGILQILESQSKVQKFGVRVAPLKGCGEGEGTESEYEG
jgi:hypothetical protein